MVRIRKYYCEAVKIKSYNTKGRKKPQKKINLPVSTKFNESDKVILMIHNEYLELMDIKENVAIDGEYEELKTNYDALKNENQILEETVVAKDKTINDLANEINEYKHKIEVLETEYNLMFYKMLVRFNNIASAKLHNANWINRLLGNVNVNVTDKDLEPNDLLK